MATFKLRPEDFKQFYFANIESIDEFVEVEILNISKLHGPELAIELILTLLINNELELGFLMAHKMITDALIRQECKELEDLVR